MNVRIHPILKNFYVYVLVLFFVWMLFFDSNDIVSQFQLSSKLSALKSEKEFYLAKIEEVKEERKELFSNDELLEKFAREKYLMKKEGEDVYVLIEE